MDPIVYLQDPSKTLKALLNYQQKNKYVRVFVSAAFVQNTAELSHEDQQDR